MQRDVFSYLKAWAEDSRRKPLVLRGARQVGKSWLVRALGATFDDFLEINFDRDPRLARLFESGADPKVILRDIGNYFNRSPKAGKTLLFLDEIQACPAAITALRYFYEEMPQLHVIAAGSLLDFELHKISVPVGRISFLYVHPMSLGEFLDATERTGLRAALRDGGFKTLSAPLHERLMRAVAEYAIVGGMPEAVKTFAESGSFADVAIVQSDLIETYRSDFAKYAKRHQVEHLSMVMEAVPLLVGKKFKYAAVSKDHRAAAIKAALALLERAGLVRRVRHSHANGLPLAAQVDVEKFKAVFFDVGLAQRILKFDARALVMGGDVIGSHNGATAESFVAQELVAYGDARENATLFYWHREARSSNAEVDQVIACNGRVVPVEVKSGEGGSMRSLHSFMSEKSSAMGCRISLAPYSRFDRIVSVPFYAIEHLTAALIKEDA
jgi:predicted AAA+ superfamily ATPase